MQSLFVVVFWSSAALVVYTYAIYPPFVWVLGRLFGYKRTAPVFKDDDLATIALLIAAHNEEAVIAQRLANALALEYPAGKLEIIVVSDGSSDRTAELVRNYADRGVRLIELTQRHGKAAALNRAMAQIQADIVILSDANTELDPSAARALIRWFDDPTVGVVCGRLVLADPERGNNADSLYWRFETMLKQSEARLGGLLGANGAIYAIRRSLYVPVPDGTIVEDLVIPLLAKIRSGCSIVFDAEAIAREESAPDIREEFRRRSRIGAGNIQSVGLLWPLLDPRRGFICLSFFSHKLLRWLCPLLLIGLLASSIALSGHPMYRLALFAQLAVLAIAIFASITPRQLRLPKLVKLAAMFVGMNAALLVGYCRWLFVGQSAWQPTARSRDKTAMDRGLRRWLIPYVQTSKQRRSPRAQEPVHLLLCIADHFEPQNGNVSSNAASARVDRWLTGYPKLFRKFRDSDGRPPQHTFFYPMELYEESHLDALAQLRDDGFGEVEVHLHHDNDTGDALRSRLLEYKELLASRHRLLSRARDGEIVYGFIHGNWALDNSHPEGRFCGVNNELDVLRETGCYADFTFPSAPSPTQPSKINSIYYACDNPLRPMSHDSGVDVGIAKQPDRSLMLIQGPLLLNWRQRKRGVAPSIENGCIQASQMPAEARIDLWLRARVQVPQRLDWFFVKLYTHGATDANLPALLGEPMVRFHEALTRRAERDRCFHYHYVSAREMYNLVRAAEAGWTGSVQQARDFELVPVARQLARPALLELPKAG